MNLLIGVLLAVAGVFLLVVGIKGTYGPVARTLGIGGSSGSTGDAGGSPIPPVPPSGGIPGLPSSPLLPVVV